MILNQEYNLAYVHIPKCAGSTVKSQLRPIDQTQGRFERIEPHPVYGSLHTAHLPLWLLRALYPDDYEALRGCDAYTVVRDPFDRFQSALAQRIRQFHDRDPFELTPTELRKEINAVVRFLSDNPNDPRLEISISCVRLILSIWTARLWCDISTSSTVSTLCCAR